MDILFVQEAVYLQYKNDFYSDRIEYPYYWERYLTHFSNVIVLARVKKVNNLPEGYHCSSGHGVQFVGLPFYNGLLGFLKKRLKVKRIIKKHIDRDVAYILRIPGLIGGLVCRQLRKKRLSYVVEVVGDPFEVAQFLALPFPLKQIYKHLSSYSMKKIVKKSIAALYVTEKILQKHYPVMQNAITASASNVMIHDEDLIEVDSRRNSVSTVKDRLNDMNAKPIRIGVVGMLYRIKSPLEIVEAAKILIDGGANVEVSFVGDGPLLSNIKDLAQNLGIANRIMCLGKLRSGKDVFEFLDSIDLYLQFSKTEGLPRALVEALARGCPAIATNVGGIPEIIPEDLLVDPSDVNALAERISWFLQNKGRMEKAVEENVQTAKRFLNIELSKKRKEFYSSVYNHYQKLIQ